MFNNKPYSTFICYRRTEAPFSGIEYPIGSYVARIIYEYLRKEGISVCYDVESFTHGEDYIDESTRIIKNEIRCFILILTPHALDRCLKEEDPLYRELCLAFSKLQEEKQKASIHYSNRFRCFVVNPDRLFKHEECIPDGLDAEIKKWLKNATATNIEFSTDSFEDGIKKLVKNIRDVLKEEYHVDNINDKYQEGKDTLPKINSSSESFIWHLINKYSKKVR